MSTKHLNEKQIAVILAARKDMVKYLGDLQASIKSGDVKKVIEFCNTGSVGMDVETILGRRLRRCERIALLNTPETHKSAPLRRAHSVALNMKNTRALCRTLLRQGRIQGAIPALDALKVEFTTEGAYTV